MSSRTITLEVRDLFSVQSAQGIEKQLMRLTGVAGASMNPATGSATLPPGAGTMAAHVDHPRTHGPGSPAAPAAARVIALAFSLPIFAYSPMGMDFIRLTPPFGMPLDVFLFGLASAAILYPVWPFVIAAYRALRARSQNLLT